MGGTRACALALLALASTGCTSLFEVNGGYAHSVTRGTGAVTADAYAGFRDAGVQMRTKFSSSVTQVGLGGHGFFIDKLGHETYGFVRVGADALQLGSSGDRSIVGLLCPFVSPGILLKGISLGASAGYDWRLTSAKNDLWLGLTLGVGVGSTR